MSISEQERLRALMRTLLRPQEFATEQEWKREAVELVLGLPGVRCAEFVVPGEPAVLGRADGSECRSDCPGRLAEAGTPGRVVLEAEPGSNRARLVVSAEGEGSGFEARCRGRLELVQPAFEHGIRRALRARGGVGRVERLLEVQPWPVLLADESGEPMFRNRALRALLEMESEGERLLERLGAVARAMADAAGPPHGWGLRGEDLELRLSRCRVRLYPSRVEPGVLGGRRVILITVEAPELAYLDPARLQRDHGLSDREAEVAGHLVRGDSTKTIAAALEISPKTASHHIQAVLRKLGVSSRTAVAARILGLRQAS